MSSTKHIPSIIISTLLFSSAASAQISLKDEMSPMPSSHHWTGYYAGLNVGTFNHTLDMTDLDAATFRATIRQTSNLRFTGGLQLGYRRQMDMASVSGVYGVEVSANFADGKFKKEYGSGYSLYQLSSKNKLKTDCMAELIGGIAADKTLLFLAAGLSWVDISGKTTNLDSIPFFNQFRVNKNEWGTAFGGGMEYAFTNKISGRVKVDVITPFTYHVTDNNGNRYDIANSIIQGTVGVNYNFS